MKFTIYDSSTGDPIASEEMGEVLPLAVPMLFAAARGEADPRDLRLASKGIRSGSDTLYHGELVAADGSAVRIVIRQSPSARVGTHIRTAMQPGAMGYRRTSTRPDVCGLCQVRQGAIPAEMRDGSRELLCGACAKRFVAMLRAMGPEIAVITPAGTETLLQVEQRVAVEAVEALLGIAPGEMSNLVQAQETSGVRRRCVVLDLADLALGEAWRDRVNIQFDVNTLTLGEAEDLEEYTGLTMGALSDVLQRAQLEKTAPPTKVLTALVWIAGRRVDPTFTVAQARAGRVLDLDVGEAVAADS